MQGNGVMSRGGPPREYKHSFTPSFIPSNPFYVPSLPPLSLLFFFALSLSPKTLSYNILTIPKTNTQTPIQFVFALKNAKPQNPFSLSPFSNERSVALIFNRIVKSQARPDKRKTQAMESTPPSAPGTALEAPPTRSGSGSVAVVVAVTESSTASAPPSRYESQKRRDWNTFLQYLKNHKPPLTLARCSGAHVIEFLKYLDQFGKTRVHMSGCPFFGNPNPPSPCSCPLKQAWGSLDALIGRLRAAYEENGGRPESNPFGARAVRMYLREVREGQARARGIPYEKKKRKRLAVGNAAGASGSGAPVGHGVGDDGGGASSSDAGGGGAAAAGGGAAATSTSSASSAAAVTAANVSVASTTSSV